MKTLNTEQLGIIEAILLQTYNLKYDHLRIEILDHIASETETLIDKEALPFDSALRTVFKLWHQELQPKKLGAYKNTPRMVLNLWRRLDLNYLLILLAVCGLSFTVVYALDVEGTVVKSGIISLLIFNFFVITRTLVHVFNSTQKTVLNEYVKKGVLACLGFNVYLLVMSFVSNRPAAIDFDWGIYVGMFLALALSVRLSLGYFLMKKSLIIEEKTLKFP